MKRAGQDLCGPFADVPDAQAIEQAQSCASAGHESIAERHVFPGDRDNIRRLTVLTALAMVSSLAER